jgi:hypothetical protein
VRDGGRRPSTGLLKLFVRERLLTVPIPFSVHPIRHVPVEPATARWTVAIHRAGAWSGRRRTELRAPSAHPFWDPLGFLPLFLMLLVDVPCTVAYRLAYLLRRRTDWDVLVYRGQEVDYRPWAAATVQNVRSRAAASERAEELWRYLAEHDDLPREAGRD